MTISEMNIHIRKLDPDLPLPAYANPGDAGMDLRSTKDLVIPAAGGRALVPTGIAIAVPDGYAAFVHPRSGLAIKHGITIVNTPGTIDAGYRGEISVILMNTDPSEAFTVSRGDRIAQLVVQKVTRVQWMETQELPEAERGEGGFGSSGAN